MDATIGMEVVGNQEKIKFNRKQRLGKGGFGTVFVGVFERRRVAVKRIEHIEMEASMSKEYEKELEVIRQSNHHNVVKYLFHDVDQNFFYLVMEKCRCSLHDYFKKSGYKIVNDKKALLKILFQTTSAVQYLHSKNIIHRDIKPQNFLLRESTDGVYVQIADFGMCKIFDPEKSSTASTVKGSFGYNAAELILKLRDRDPPKSDVFSLGIVFHEIVAKGRHPFGERGFQKEDNIQQKRHPDLSAISDWVLRTLIKGMIDHIWSERPTAENVLQYLVKMFAELFSENGFTLEVAKQLLDSPFSSETFTWEATAEAEESKDVDYPPTSPVEEFEFRNYENAQGQLQASPTKDRPMETEDRPAKKVKKEENGNQAGVAVQLDNDTPDKYLKATEKSILDGDWEKATNSLDRAVNLLKNKASAKAGDLFAEAEKYSSDDRHVLSIISFYCASEQFRKDRLPKDVSWNVSHCIQKICCEANKMSKKCASSTSKEAIGKASYNKIAVEFVAPLVDQIKLKLDSIKDDVEPMDYAKNHAFALEWMATLQNKIGNYKKAAELAANGRTEMETTYKVKGCKVYRSYAGLLKEEGKAKSSIGEHKEARSLLRRAMNSAKLATDYKDDGKKDVAIRYINIAINNNNARLRKEAKKAK